MKKVLLAFLGTVALHASVPIIEKELSVDVPVSSWSEMRNDGVVRQQFDFSCGAASMATVMRYFYNRDVGERGIVGDVLAAKGVNAGARELEASDFALSFADLSDYATTKGFKGIGMALDIDSLRKLTVPVIIYIKIRNFEHFTVFRGIGEEFVHLADPSFGNMKVKLEKFKEMFYQREDLKYPGRILAIVPIDKASVYPDRTFMKTQSDSGYLYDLIESKIDK
jgi:predicted double-glycine peptidase